MHVLHHLRAFLPRGRAVHREARAAGRSAPGADAAHAGGFPLAARRVGWCGMTSAPVATPIAPSYDVVVVGAGPSGSLCARNLARAGYSVLLCEKRPVVGVPVRCGEATGPVKRLSDFTTVDEAWIETKFTGVVFHGPGGVSFKYEIGRAHV